MKFDNVVIKNKFLFISLGITIVLGIILRLLFYSYNRPLWSDEAALALNIINMNNYFITLDNGQAAPAIFMYVSKIMYQIIPYKELGLRLLPLIFSICSIFVFIKFTMEYLEKNFSIYIATTAFVLSYPLIYYAQEFKPYSWDLLSFMVILLSYFALKNIQNKWQCVFFAIIYSFLLYTSYTAFFAEFIVLLTLLLFHFDKFKKNIFIVITVFISFLAFYLSYKNSITSDYLHLYWNSGFLTLNLHQNFDLLIKNFDYIFSAKLPLLFFGLCCSYQSK